MSFTVDIDDVRADFPEYSIIAALTPSAQKAAFHVRDSNETDLCLKIISPNYELDRLNREIQAMLKIEHPNVVELLQYTFSTTASTQRHYIVESFVAGQDLEDILGEPWELQHVVPVFTQIFQGLHELKNVSIVHRDLKPSNIRITNSGTPVIIDFGLARHLDLVAITLTHEGAAIGTPIYFAPEQFRGTKHDIDYRTDLFAVGLILYRAITGEHPFYRDGMDRDALEHAVLESNEFLDHPLFLALPNPWQLFLGRLLSRDKSRRISSADQAVKIISKLIIE